MHAKKRMIEILRTNTQTKKQTNKKLKKKKKLKNMKCV